MYRTVHIKNRKRDIMKVQHEATISYNNYIITCCDDWLLTSVSGQKTYAHVWFPVWSVNTSKIKIKGLTASFNIKLQLSRVYPAFIQWQLWQALDCPNSKQAASWVLVQGSISSHNSTYRSNNKETYSQSWATLSTHIVCLCMCLFPMFLCFHWQWLQLRTVFYKGSTYCTAMDQLITPSCLRWISLIADAELMLH